MNSTLISLSYRFIIFVFASIVVLFLFNFQYKSLNVNNISGTIQGTVEMLSKHNFKVSGLSISLLDMSIKANNISFYVNSLEAKKDIKTSAKNNVTIKDVKVKYSKDKNKNFDIKNIKLDIDMDRVVLSSNGKDVVLDSVNGNVIYKDSKINVNDLNVHAFDGVLLSSIVYDDGKINGSLNLKKVDLSKIKSPKLKISTGILSGKSVFALNDKMPYNIVAKGYVELKDSNINNSAIAGSMVGVINGNASVGDISVKRLYSKFSINNGDTNLKKISLDSSSINAVGNINISKDEEIDGLFKLSGMKGLTGSSVYVKGSVDNPVIVPSVGTSVGVAVGSVVAGPVGAVVGSKVGSVIEDTFKSLF